MISTVVEHSIVSYPPIVAKGGGFNTSRLNDFSFIDHAIHAGYVHTYVPQNYLTWNMQSKLEHSKNPSKTTYFWLTIIFA